LSPTEEGLKITRIIGQSESLACLRLYSSNADTTTPGLLESIADGFPNLDISLCHMTTTSQSLPTSSRLSPSARI
jgi:hypothetical protein